MGTEIKAVSHPHVCDTIWKTKAHLLICSVLRRGADLEATLTSVWIQERRNSSRMQTSLDSNKCGWNLRKYKTRQNSWWPSNKMKIRVVQIWGFLMTVLGWIFIACTMAMEGWKIASIGGMGGSSIIKVAWYWSSLWRSCFTDSTAVSNCYDFPVLWSVQGR